MLVRRSEDGLLARLRIIRCLNDPTQPTHTALEAAGLTEQSRSLTDAMRGLEGELDGTGSWQRASAVAVGISEQLANELRTNPKPRLLEAHGLVHALAEELRGGMRCEGMGRAAQSLVEGLEVEVQVASSGVVEGLESSPVDVACLALLAKFLALELESEKRDGEATEVSGIGDLAGCFERDAAAMGLPDKLAAVPLLHDGNGSCAASTGETAQELLQQVTSSHHHPTHFAPCVLCQGPVDGHRCDTCAGVFCPACCFSGRSSYGY